MVLRLNVLCNRWERGKCLSTNFKNILAIFFDTFWLYGGLNQIIFLCLLIVFLLVGAVESLEVCSVLKPLLLNASSYWCFDSLKISLLDEFLDNLSLMVVLSCFKICGGWLDKTSIYLSSLYLSSLFKHFKAMLMFAWEVSYCIVFKPWSVIKLKVWHDLQMSPSKQVPINEF